MQFYQNAHLLICYKNFSKDHQVSHVGLGVTANYTAKSLRQRGIFAEAKAIYGADDLELYIKLQELTGAPVTHVVICAQWIPTKFIAKLVIEFPKIVFALNCHSGVGFLQAEPPAIDLVRQAIDLQIGTPNFFASSNNMRLCNALQAMYGHPITYLPNLYFTHGHENFHRPLWNGGVLKIGIFGSARIYKNMSTAVAAAVELASKMKCHAEIWMNAGRHDGAGNVVYRTAQSWTRGLPHIQLKELHWTSWPEFRRFIGSMNVHLAPSYTETFCNIVADGICEGTPSVVSDVIEWAPKTWMANCDESSNVADVARRLLFDPHAAHDGYAALQNYVKVGVPHWQAFLSY